MAFIDGQDEELDPNNPQQGQAPQVGGGSQVAGGSQGASSAGVGPGGTGGWTNIQAYLNANQGDTGSSQLLNKAVGDQFGQERSNFQNDSSKFLGDAQSQADQNKITNDQANDYIGQAATAYQYPGSDGKGGFKSPDLPTAGGEFSGGSQQKATPGQPAPNQIASPTDPSHAADYGDIVSKFQKALNDPYSGPKEYNYGFGDQTQQYGADLKDTPSFDTLMNGLYSKAAGSPLTAGQYDLQKQFDVNNQALGDTRKTLNDQYTQLGADRDKTVQDTTAGLSGIEQGYRQNQNALKDYLGGQSNSYDQSIGQKEGAARDAYGAEYGGKSGLGSIGYDALVNGQDDGGLAGDIARSRINNRQGLGIWDPNLSWKQLQTEQDDRYKGDPHFVGPQLWYNHDQDWTDRANTLGNWYTNEDNKYSGTADNEKRSYNAIQDFLNSGAAKKDQAFHVRG